LIDYSLIVKIHVFVIVSNINSSGQECYIFQRLKISQKINIYQNFVSCQAQVNLVLFLFQVNWIFHKF